jgi:hypothetical protein
VSRHLALAPDLEQQLLRAAGASHLALGARLQALWSGYGEVRRVELSGAATPQAILKHVSPPALTAGDLRGAAGRSHQRKLRSYEVELLWYQHFAGRCGDKCRVPSLLYGCHHPTGWLFLLEDLDAAGFPERRSRLRPEELLACLTWLANFHATFLNVRPQGLWKTGTYWYLGTRQDELLAMPAGALKEAAHHLDAKLNQARFRSFVHGDAKVENLCFSRHRPAVAALDFQYVGGGVGVRDLAYFLGSALSPRELEAQGDRLLDLYLRLLGEALASRGDLFAPAVAAGDSLTQPSEVAAPAAEARDSDEVAASCPQPPKASYAAPPLSHDAVVSEWRRLYPVAWADFQRFLLGWAPGTSTSDRYSARMLKQALAEL